MTSILVRWDEDHEVPQAVEEDKGWVAVVDDQDSEIDVARWALLDTLWDYWEAPTEGRAD